MLNNQTKQVKPSETRLNQFRREAIPEPISQMPVRHPSPLIVGKRISIDRENAN